MDFPPCVATQTVDHRPAAFDGVLLSVLVIDLAEEDVDLLVLRLMYAIFTSNIYCGECAGSCNQWRGCRDHWFWRRVAGRR